LRVGAGPALALLCLALLAAGCGDSSDLVVRSAPDRHTEISELRQRKQRLQQRLRGQEEGEDAAGRKMTGPAAGKAGLNRLLSQLPGEAGLAAGAPGSGDPALAGGTFTTGDAWSTVKVPIVERVLADAGGPEGLTDTQADQINRAITLSDNDAAAALFSGLEQAHGGLAGASAAVGEMLRQAGDDETVISTVGRDGFSTYGQTDWSLTAQYRYMAALAGGCVSEPSSREYLLGEMSRVGGSDTYGLGETGFPASWKGGWGPGTDGGYLVRQMGIMNVAGREIVMAMAAVPDDGSFETGRSMVSQMARWAAANLPDRIRSTGGC